MMLSWKSLLMLPMLAGGFAFAGTLEQERSRVVAAVEQSPEAPDGPRDEERLEDDHGEDHAGDCHNRGRGPEMGKGHQKARGKGHHKAHGPDRDDHPARDGARGHGKARGHEKGKARGQGKGKAHGKGKAQGRGR